MQLSYNVIKNLSVTSSGDKEIVTHFNNTKDNNMDVSEESNSTIRVYDGLVKTMLDNARKQSEDIIEKAYIQVEALLRESEENKKLLTQQAYEEGYKEGYNKGFSEGKEDGFKKVYEETIGVSTQEANTIKEEAVGILKKAEYDYKTYLNEKQDEIKRVIISATEAILKNELKDKESMNAIIFNVIAEAKNQKSYIIKCNPYYEEELKNNIDLWKSQLAFQGDIFIIADNSINEGRAIIEKDTGIVEVGLNTGINELKEIIGVR